jgi:O-antigen ligase
MSFTRPSRRTVLLITLPLACLWAILLVYIARRGAAEPVARPAVNPALSAAAGVNLDASELESATLEQRLAALQDEGIRWVRLTLPWDEIEPQRGAYDWAAWDAIMARFAQHPAIIPVVALDRAPAWARGAVAADNAAASPHERADFGRFAAAVAERYGQQLRYYQIWHEPNIAPHWGSKPADPADYLGLLREASVNIRQQDGDAQIVLAALAPTTETGGANLSDITYLDTLYALGGRAWFDIVAGEPYGFSAPADAAPDPAALNFGRASLLRDVMVRHGDGDTPLWATAFGWNAPLPGSGRTPWGSVTEQQQAQYAADAYGIAARERPWLGPLLWAAYCPQRPADDPWLGFSLCGADGSPRPAWQALTAASQPPGFLAAGTHAPDHPALHYSEGWRVTASAADPSADGDSLTFSFHGTELGLRVQGGPFWALYRITVDGQPANALPRDESGAAYLALHDPYMTIKIVPVATGLTESDHSVRLEATGGWGQWALQGIVVGAGSAPALSPRLLLALAVTLSLAWALLILLWPATRRPAAALSRLLDRGAGLPELLLYAAAILPSLLLIVQGRAMVDLACLAALGLVFLIRPDLSLPLIAASLPFWQTPEHLARWDFTHVELFVLLGTLALAARAVLAWRAGTREIWSAEALLPPRQQSVRAKLAQRNPEPRVRSLDLPAAALVVAGLLSTVAAAEQGVAWREFRIVFLLGGLFYVLITTVPPRPGTRFLPWPLLTGLFAGMAAASLIGLWQLATGQGRIDVEGVWRVRGLYGSPNNLALVLDRAIPLALSIAAFLAAGPRWTRVAAGAATLLMLAACVATFSKGALLLGLPVGLAVVLIGGAWRARKRWPLAVLALAAVIALAGAVVLFRTPRFADLLNFQSGTSFLRIKLWQAALNMAFDHPLLGVGPDNFLYAYRTHYVLPSAWEELNLSHPHNILLDLWTRLGLLGIVAGAWALSAGFVWTWRLFRRGSAGVWPIALGLLAGLAATVAHGLIDNSLFLPDLMALFVMALGLCARLAGHDFGQDLQDSQD